MWIGLDDIKKEGTFFWNDGTSLAGGKKFPLWRKGKQNLTHNSLCILLLL